MPDSFNVSPQQERQWLVEPYGPSARIQLELELTGPLDEAALHAALRETVQRHEILRTTFVRQPGVRVPLQTIHEQLEPAWRTLDLQSLASEEQALALTAAARKELADPIDLAEGPVVQALLARSAPERSTLVLTLTALHADVPSVSSLLAELVHHYTAEGELVQEPLQYADFAEAQRELATSQEPVADEARAHWSGLWGASSPSLPFAKEATGAFTPSEVSLQLDSGLEAEIERQAASLGTTVDTFVQAAWHALLGRSTGQDNVAVGFVEPQTHHPDLVGAIGAFSRALPVQTRVASDVPFRDVVLEVEHARAQHAEWGDYAPAELEGSVHTGFVAVHPFHAQAAGVTASLERVTTSGPQFRLWLTCETPPQGLRLVVRFDPRHLEPERVNALAGQLERLLQAVAADGSIVIGAPDLLDAEERTRLVAGFNETARPIPPLSAHELIAAHAASTPGATAVVDERGSLSYAALEMRANQLAGRLRRSGVGPDVTVALCMDRSLDTIVGLLGILKAGGAYVPLNYEHPPVRLAQQLSASGARAIVTQEALLGRLPQFEGDVICLDRDRAQLDAEPVDAAAAEVAPENLAYVIYTSGSTGTPKGVGVTHHNLVNYVTDIVAQLGAKEEPLAFGLVTSISTDLGNTAVFGALCSGGTLVVVSPKAAADGPTLAAQLDATPVDVLKITPSHVNALLAGGDARVLPRRWLVLGGERAPWDLIGRIREHSAVRILNHYGPTETTVGCTTFLVPDGPGRYAPASVPIGRPIANTACFILDERGRPTPIGVVGTLFIAGAGVARGYIGQPELTDERFLADPFTNEHEVSEIAQARMYDTGDRARWLPDGTIEFLGRADEQVKVRGYRVEPGEIESALRSHPQVNDAVVTATNGAGEVRLIAYCTSDDALACEELRSHLAAQLPEFMIPSAIALIDELPRTSSGKVDRRALPDPETLTEARATVYVAPRTPVEEAVAAVWAGTLGVERVGAEDDFFELGGHSLLATHTVAQLRNDFAIDLPLHALFLAPTVESLAAEIVALLDADEQGVQSL
jgi:amino acid adenylation domain-containing protein